MAHSTSSDTFAQKGRFNSLDQGYIGREENYKKEEPGVKLLKYHQRIKILRGIRIAALKIRAYAGGFDHDFRQDVNPEKS